MQQAIREEERKKKAPEPADSGFDELTLYIRSPAPNSQPTSRRVSQLSRRSNAEDTEMEPSDKIEIDSDNIETPPATRRLFSPPKDLKLADMDSTPKRDRTASATTTPSRDADNSYTDLGSGKLFTFDIFYQSISNDNSY